MRWGDRLTISVFPATPPGSLRERFFGAFVVGGRSREKQSGSHEAEAIARSRGICVWWSGGLRCIPASKSTVLTEKERERDVEKRRSAAFANGEMREAQWLARSSLSNPQSFLSVSTKKERDTEKRGCVACRNGEMCKAQWLARSSLSTPAECFIVF